MRRVAGDDIFVGDNVLKFSGRGESLQSEGISARPSPAAPVPAMGAGAGRYCDRPMDWGTRLAGLGGTCAIYGLVLAVALTSWYWVQPPMAPLSRPLTVMTLARLETPPEPVKNVAPGPEQVERQAAKPRPVSKVVPKPLVQLPFVSLNLREPSEPLEPVDPGTPVPQTTAPESIPAPPVNRLASDAKPNWEGRLLAHLERFRRYPASARAARRQGVVTIRFTMNRAGTVLASRVEQSSGVAMLDMAALDTLKRAQPLPPIPADRPDTVELMIPVEYFLKR